MNQTFQVDVLYSSMMMTKRPLQEKVYTDRRVREEAREYLRRRDSLKVRTVIRLAHTKPQLLLQVMTKVHMILRSIHVGRRREALLKRKQEDMQEERAAKARAAGVLALVGPVLPTAKAKAKARPKAQGKAKARARAKAKAAARNGRMLRRQAAVPPILAFESPQPLFER